MKILVTGATGFIGKELVKKLDEKGHDIVVLTRNKETARFHIPIYCEVHEWDPEKKPLPTNSLKDIDAVINLAGENIASSFWTENQKNKLMSSRIMSARRIVQSMGAMNEKPKVFLSASAIGFYGDRGDEELNETSSEGAGFLSQICQSWENEITKSNELGIRTVICRLGMVLGHDGGALEKIIPAFKLGVGGKLGDGSQWMSWIHINDFVDMMIYSLETPSVNGIINAVSPNPVKNVEFTKTLGRILKRPTILPVPSILLKMGLRDLSDLLLYSQKVSAEKICKNGFEFKYPKLEEAFKEVCEHSYHEIKIEQWVPQSINKTFAFFKEAKNLEKLTPDFLKFKILSQSTPEIQNGTKFTYRLSLHGIPVTWKSKISDWKPVSKFSDIQIKGPYSHWYHTHKFEEKNGGTLIKDHVVYKVPFGLLGDLIVGKWIKKDLETIFSYRTKTIDTLMNN
ncbi:MAG: TIGR01777 family protein [Nitrospina sp.]|jgi:uncharacterized protein (TIGR01777 family)|nr:TIGR01777 family protein [Nitrospina sp.]